MNHQAIYEVHPNVISILENGSALDSQGLSVTLDITSITVATQIIELENKKAAKEGEIRREFYASSSLPVTDAKGDIWTGGFDSAIKLDAAQRLATTAGFTTVTFFDESNVGKILTMPEAIIVVMTVANDYQVKLAKKQGLLLQISAATTQAGLDLIVW